MLGQIEHKLFINCVEKFSQLFKFISVKKIYFYIILLIFIFNKSFACQLLNVPIGSNVSSAVSTFEFIDAYSTDVYGDEFKEKYLGYEESGKGRVTLNARDLWFQIMDAQMETGTPYLLYKDACNNKSNQKMLVLLNKVIYVVKLSSILMIKKLPYVI